MIRIGAADKDRYDILFLGALMVLSSVLLIVLALFTVGRHVYEGLQKGEEGGEGGEREGGKGEEEGKGEGGGEGEGERGGGKGKEKGGEGAEAEGSAEDRKAGKLTSVEEAVRDPFESQSPVVAFVGGDDFSDSLQGNRWGVGKASGRPEGALGGGGSLASLRRGPDGGGGGRAEKAGAEPETVEIAAMREFWAASEPAPAAGGVEGGDGGGALQTAQAARGGAAQAAAADGGAAGEGGPGRAKQRARGGMGRYLGLQLLEAGLPRKEVERRLAALPTSMLLPGWTRRRRRPQPPSAAAAAEPAAAGPATAAPLPAAAAGSGTEAAPGGVAGSAAAADSAAASPPLEITSLDEGTESAPLIAHAAAIFRGLPPRVGDGAASDLDAARPPSEPAAFSASFQASWRRGRPAWGLGGAGPPDHDHPQSPPPRRSGEDPSVRRATASPPDQKPRADTPGHGMNAGGAEGGADGGIDMYMDVPRPLTPPEDSEPGAGSDHDGPGCAAGTPAPAAPSSATLQLLHESM